MTASTHLLSDCQGKDMSKLKRSDCKVFVKLVIITTSLKQAASIVKLVEPDQALAISEIILNILEGNVPLAPVHKKTFAKYKTLLRKLGTPKLRPAARVKLIVVNAKVLAGLLRLVKTKLLSILEQI